MHEQHTRVGASFQAIAFIVSLSIISVVFGIRYKMFITDDPLPVLNPNEISSDKNVHIGLHIAHLSQFDIIHNKFTLDGTIWFAFNPHKVPLEAIKKFSIFNGTLLYVSEPLIRRHNETTTIAQFRIRSEFHTPLNYRMFPFDDHRINFIITNDYTDEDVLFQSNKNDLTFENNLFIPGWRMIKNAMQAGYKEVILEQGNKQYRDTRQEVMATIFCERSDPGVMINILLTLLIMLFISMLTFSSAEDSVLVVTVSLVALIGYRAIMQEMTPSHASYFMYSDFLYLLTMLGVITALFTDIATRAGKWNTETTKQFCIAGIYGFFILSCVVIMFIH